MWADPRLPSHSMLKSSASITDVCVNIFVWLYHSYFKRTSLARLAVAGQRTHTVCVCVCMSLRVPTPTTIVSFELGIETLKEWGSRLLWNHCCLLLFSLQTFMCFSWQTFCYNAGNYGLKDLHVYRNHTSEISCHLFVQAVELLPVFESGGVWHGPVAGTSHHGGHQRRRRGGRARRQTANVDIPVNKPVTADF